MLRRRWRGMRSITSWDRKFRTARRTTIPTAASSVASALICHPCLCSSNSRITRWALKLNTKIVRPSAFMPRTTDRSCCTTRLLNLTCSSSVSMAAPIRATASTTINRALEVSLVIIRHKWTNSKAVKFSTEIGNRRRIRERVRNMSALAPLVTCFKPRRGRV